MGVDLSSGAEGVIIFEDGLTFWCPIIIRDSDDKFSVRWESGWYKSYTRDGKSICAGVILKRDGTEERVVGKNIISFTPGPYPGGMPRELTP